MLLANGERIAAHHVVLRSVTAPATPCRLKGAQGDALHAIACAAGYNLHWLLRWIALFCAWLG